MSNNPLYIIAEISANHNNDLELTYRTIDAIVESGADAVKVQTYTADSLTLDVDNEFFGPRKDGLWKGQRPYDVFSQGALRYEWHKPLKDYTESKGLDFFSSPFDQEGVDLLNSLNVSRYKIASFEITNIPLIEYTAKQGKPIIISTGVANIEDIQLAIDTCRKVGNNEITILKCTSEYPAVSEMANLLTIPNMIEKFGVAVGLSDHTFGSTVPIVAVSLGARVIEKHFILDRNLGGPDAAFSMEPKEFKEMVEACKDAHKALGQVSYELTERNRLRRSSIFVAENIRQGEVFTEKNLRSVRPGFGLHPKYLDDILGKKAISNLEKGIPFSLNFIQSR